MSVVGWIIVGAIIIISIVFVLTVVLFRIKKRSLLYNLYKHIEVENQNYITNDLPKLKLNPIRVEIPLEENEIVYGSGPVQVLIYPVNKKNETIPQSKYVIPFPNALAIGYGEGKKSGIINRHVKPLISGALYITNQRIFVSDGQTTVAWILNQIENIELTVFNYMNHLYQGFFLYADQKKHVILTKQLSIPYLIMKVWQNG